MTADDDGDGVPFRQDCNDSDPTVYPTAPDPEGDGIDQNCDGVDGDASDTGQWSGAPPSG